MRAVLQRVSAAELRIDGELRAQIGVGFLVLLGITDGDTPQDAELLAEKCIGLRVFSDSEDKMNRSLCDIGGNLLVVSQFTLYADCRKGRRPSFTDAARPETAIPLYEHFLEYARAHGAPSLQTGVFGADMKITFTNDGPVTILLDSDKLKRSRK